ncbi:4Fe-4S single cluster domain-containing protein [Parageobacillus sp. G301]|uniref:4Fe-4S single cluster domain-containing protein n=1 Tax=Parageobacillus sp. G301 TaxID=2998290 RepID=UPI002555B739|nr:4Fe-4S single cluster domain-containing protein [Parageobacillus sp. G301]
MGFGKRIGIWTIGCPHACLNCSNPELWEENRDKDLPMSIIFQMLRSIHQPIDGVTITGGEPFQQVDELAELVSFIHEEITDDILIYSGYTLRQLKSWKNENVNRILNTISVLIDGKYIEEKNDNKPLRGSANQKVHILNEKYRERYELLLKGKRSVQTVFFHDNVIAIGIPMKHTKQRLAEQLSHYGVQIKQNLENI